MIQLNVLRAWGLVWDALVWTGDSVGPQLGGGELSAIIKTFMPFACLCLLDKRVVTVKISLEGFLFYLVEIGVPFGEGNGTTLQCSCLENPLDGGAGWAAVHGVAKSWARLSHFPFTFHFHALEKEMATHSSVLAWRIPGTEEPSGLPSVGSHRVGHD